MHRPGLTQRHTLHYSQALDTLAEFQNLPSRPNRDSLTVWITHPKSHTKINPTHFAARGLTLSHTLFLESTAIHRTLSSLIHREQIDAIILDGYPTDRVLLQLARRWLKIRTDAPTGAHDLICADDLMSSRNRLFIMGR